MVDFRKWLFALAIVGLLLAIGSTPANAQTGSFICQATAGVPFQLRSEGITELVGDLTLNCTGGTPTPSGTAVPLNNIQISINTNITSRIEDSTSGASEALLMIDEPYPTPGTEFPAQPIGPTAKQANAIGQLACLAINSTNCAITSKNPTSLGVIGQGGNYDGTSATGPGPNNNHYNIFQGFQNGTNAIAWDGVPIDAPGTTGTRVIRITNVRANAFALGVSSTLIPTSINMIIAVSGSSQISIFQPGNGNVVGQIAQGLIGSLTTGSYAQCTNLNGDLLKGVVGQTGTLLLTAKEGFASAFKPQSYFQTFTAGVQTGTRSYVGPGNTALNSSFQNVPGFNYVSESGFYPGPLPGTDVASGTDPIGLADHGTQIQFTISGVGAGVSLFAPPYVYLTGPYGTGTGASSTTQGVAVLTSASFITSGAITSASTILLGTGASPGVNPAPVQLAISGTTASITYEIYYADASVPETLSVPVEAAYITTGPTNPAPTTTPVTAAINYAPLSSVGTADSSDPIPRFGQPYAAANLFTINLCSCNLLFPFVTNIAGFDTGIAIANTTADTLNGLAPQSGPVTLTYYGTTTGGGAAPATQVTTSSVPAGAELVFTLSSGGNYGILGTPGFEGYMVVRASFQYCHGFAAITDQGAQRLGEGYLALSLDLPVVTTVPGPTGLNRTGQAGENLGH
jgi:hypothetical protein